MFCWTETMVRFMQDAAENSPYQRELAQWICSQLPRARHVCDAGCGLGFLSLELVDRFPEVTAADMSRQALDVLRASAAARGLAGLHVLQTDMMHYAPTEPFDAMVFCLFGQMDEVLRIAKRCCKGTVVVVKKAFTHHRFSVSSVPLRHETTDQAAAYLRAHGVGFELETRAFEMGQPLRSVDEAVRFFETYSKDAPGALTREAVEKRLIRTQDEAFPFYLPQEKSLGRFTLNAADIPEEFI